MRLANPKTKTKRKANPTPADFAALASGLLSTVQLGEHLGVMKTTKKRKTVKRKTTRRNPTAAASKLRNSATSKTATANPRKKVSVPAKGRFYLMTVAKGDDLLGVFINDRDGDGITKKFKSVAAAKAFATKNRLALENPAATPRTVQLTATFLKRNPWFDFALYDKDGRNVKSTVRALTERGAVRKLAKKYKPTGPIAIQKVTSGRTRNPTPKVKGQRSKVNPVRKPARSKGSVANPRKTASIKATPTAAKANPRIYTIKDGDQAKDIDVRKPFRQPKHIVWCNTCNCFRRESHKTHVRKNPTPRTSKTSATSKTSRTRPNPAAVPRRRTFEMFNGRPATKSKVVPCSKLLGSGARVDQLGKLHEIHMESGEILKLNPNKFNLVAKGGRLWIVGGKFHSGPKVDRKINPWGKIKNIVYSTHKPHHGDRPGQHYIHEMGEWSGNRPTLSLDNEGFPVIQGGSYKIEDRGIVD